MLYIWILSFANIVLQKKEKSHVFIFAFLESSFHSKLFLGYNLH